MTRQKMVICPYCGQAQTAAERCGSCLGLFESLSRQATHNQMGPWFVRDPGRPFQPGCSYETLVKMIERRQVTKFSIIRGPTTRQFWTVARHAPGVAHLLGYCHACDASVDPEDHGCHACGVPFGAYLDRNYMGLPEVRPLPWEPGYDERRDDSMMSGGGGASETAAWGRPSSRSGNLSSFATDAELMGSAAGPASQPAGAPPGAGAGAGAGAEVGTSAFAAGPSAQSATAAMMEGASAAAPGRALPLPGQATRSMQRRIEQQQRTIRMLAVGLVVLAAMSIVLVIGRLGGPRDQPSSSPATAPESAAGPASPAPAAPIEDAPLLPPAASPRRAVEPPTNASTTPAQPPPDDVSAANDNPHLIEYVRAKNLLSLAMDAQRELDERIRHADEAVQVLENIEKSLPPDQHPPDLKQVLSDARREHERLVLRKLMP